MSEQQLRGLSEAEIERTLKELCEPLGGLENVSFRTGKSGEQLCFIRLAVAENQTRLYSLLNGMSFADSYVVRIPR
jgi:hypothetical protein